ncbi:MAG TPA: efflux RND transporter periplasmic adaptor subunit [Ramlibacter sp.]|uniref:efflux RND transporter periplasmic adaptor subunit n=1 Tax=Ramlibacter sp. TaxID=1917967 RepID=UPI002ED298CF
MAEQLLSNSWYRVCALQPRLRTHARLHRMRYRGERWYLLQDPVSGRVHRFSPAARYLVAAMNGERTVQQLWEMCNRQLGEDAPTQDDVIRLLGQLHGADLLQTDATPDVTELFERGVQQERAARRRSWMNPMAWRIHLLDPDRFLNAMRPLVDLLWGRWGALLWLAVVLPALVLLLSQWNALIGNFSDRVLATQNLLLLWLVFPLIKALHEFGHAAACKRGGGEVHDVGVVVLVLMPVPYVEASASTVFRSRWQRAVVGGSGMAVEVFIAAIAFCFWLLIEPGLVRSALFNVMLIAGVSTLLFNGNPLLRYDAYYILADALEMPNLANRATRYWGYLIDRYAFGLREAETPETGRRERAWLAAYGVLSTIYRILVTVAIALFIAQQFFFIGVMLALWGLVTMAVLPLVKGVQHAASGRLRPQRRRVLAVSGAFVAGLLVLLFVVPAPFRTVLEGVAWLPQSALVRTAQDGFVERVVATPGSRVRAGDLLLQARNPALEANLRLAEAKVAELEATYFAHLHADRARAAMALEQLESERVALAQAREKMAQMQVRAGTAGTFVLARAEDLPGRFQRKGDLVGYVIDRPDPIARVVATQEAADVVRSAVTRVDVRMAHAPQRVLPARVEREVPAGEEYLPSRVLATEGGGQLATDMRDAHGAKTLERTFQFDVAIATGTGAPPPLFFGERVHVRFEHPDEPLGQQWLRSLRRLFLSHFHV